jgi:hypothetical protein
MKEQKTLQQICLIIFGILTAGRLMAQTTVNPGIVSGTWTEENSPYRVMGNIVVPADSLLMIEHGVRIEFQGTYNLTVNGSMKVNGEKDDSVTFTASNIETGWRGIRIIGPATDTIQIHYGIIENVIAGIDYPDNYYGAISIDNNVVLSIDNSRSKKLNPHRSTLSLCQ